MLAKPGFIEGFESLRGTERIKIGINTVIFTR